MSVDVRTRVDGAAPPFDATTFLEHELPARLADHAALLASADHLALRPLVVTVDGATWTLRRDVGRWSVAAGAAVADDERHVAVRLAPQELADLVHDQVTPIGLMTAGTLDVGPGRIGHLLDWWLVLRSIVDGRPIHVPGPVTDLPDDLHRSFAPGDDPDAMADFLAAAGFLHLRGAFTAAEMAAIDADMDAATPRYQPDDGRSWWATVADGSRRLVRMQGFDEHSGPAAALLDDPRLLALGELGRAGHVHTGLEGNRVEALFKPIGVQAGISDVPWHKDCSLGRHSYECCSLTVGVSVTGAGPGSGQLRVVAGSHRALVWPSLLDPSTTGLPEVALATEVGDITIHLSCTLHMAEPPTTRERRVLYTSFRLPAPDAEAAATARRALIATARERAPLTTSQSRPT